MIDQEDEFDLLDIVVEFAPTWVLVLVVLAMVGLWAAGYLG